MTYLGDERRIGDMRSDGYRQKVWTGARWVELDQGVLKLLAARQGLAGVAELLPESTSMLAAIDALLKEATL